MINTRTYGSGRVGVIGNRPTGKARSSQSGSNMRRRVCFCGAELSKVQECSASVCHGTADVWQQAHSIAKK
jgi:hypothetical protein